MSIFKRKKKVTSHTKELLEMEAISKMAEAKQAIKDAKCYIDCIINSKNEVAAN